MNKPPSFQFYAQDFLTGVIYLTNEEIGIYIKMLAKQWTDGKIPKKRLGFLIGCEWEDLPEELTSKFTDLGGYIINERLEIEREKKGKFLKKQSVNGKKGGRPNLDMELTSNYGDVIPRDVNEQDHFLYIFKRKSTGTFKIGETQNLFKRRLTIKIPTSDLQIIHFIKIDKDKNLAIEKDLKEKFKNNHIFGDWFDFTEAKLIQLIKYFNTLKNPNDSQKKPLEDEIEKEIEIEDEIEDEIEKEKIDFEKIKSIFNSLDNKIPNIKSISKKRESLVKARIKEYDLETIGDVLRKVSESSFLNGANSNGWTATFDWIFNQANFLKILEDNYINKSNERDYKEIFRDSVERNAGKDLKFS